MTELDGTDVEPCVTVVVMAYNEAASLAEVAAEIQAALATLLPRPSEILIVDDGSTDGTAELADALAGAANNILVRHHQPNLGLGEVYRTGLEHSRGTFVTFFPADGQFPASIIPEFVAAAQTRDLVLGYLPERGDSIVGRMLSWTQRMLYRLLIGSLPRFQGVLMVRRAILADLNLTPSGRAATIVFEMLLKVVAGDYQVVSLPTSYRPRRAGQSKVNNLRTIRSNLTALMALRRRLANPSGHAGGTRARAWPFLLACLGLCLATYQPWRPEPFDILDFSEFLAVLQRGRGLLDRFVGLATYYGAQGRVNELGYAIIAGTYQVFGLDPVGWQLVRQAQAALVAPAVYLTLMAFGGTAGGAAAGASLYLAGTVGASAWLRQTGEPLGTLFFLGATLQALRWRQGGPAARTLITFGCLAGMLLCKETLVATMPFLCLVVAYRRRIAGETPAQVWSAAVGYGSVCGAACLMLAVLLGWAQTLRQPDAYAALYGTASATSVGAIWRLAQVTLPISFEGTAAQLLLFPANLIFLAVCCTLAALVVGRSRSRTVMPLCLIALSLPAAGVLVYLPWPRFEAFYALPFLFGISLLVATLFDGAALKGRGRACIAACWLFVVAVSALYAYGFAEYTRARRRLNHEIATTLASLSPQDTPVVVSARLTPQSWQNPAATFERYLRVLKLTSEPPDISDVSCDGSGPSETASRPVGPLAVYLVPCINDTLVGRTLHQEFRHFDWSQLAVRTDSIRALLVQAR